jgi:uncharacterized protein YgiM (DUF1202 family)
MKAKKIVLLVILALVLCLASTGAALAMSSANYNLPWDVLSGGGGDRESGSYRLGDTVGQSSAIGPSESTNYRLGGGFWYGVTVTVNVGTCGDVNDDDNVNMADVMILWYDIADYPSAGAWTVSSEWAADVNCDGYINMADVMILWYDIADYPSAGAWEVNCCE